MNWGPFLSLSFHRGRDPAPYGRCLNGLRGATGTRDPETARWDGFLVPVVNLSHLIPRLTLRAYAFALASLTYYSPSLVRWARVNRTGDRREPTERPTNRTRGKAGVRHDRFQHEKQPFLSRPSVTRAGRMNRHKALISSSYRELQWHPRIISTLYILTEPILPVGIYYPFIFPYDQPGKMGSTL